MQNILTRGRYPVLFAAVFICHWGNVDVFMLRPIFLDGVSIQRVPSRGTKFLHLLLQIAHPAIFPSYVLLIFLSTILFRAKSQPPLVWQSFLPRYKRSTNYESLCQPGLQAQATRRKHLHHPDSELLVHIARASSKLDVSTNAQNNLDKSWKNFFSVSWLCFINWTSSWSLSNKIKNDRLSVCDGTIFSFLYRSIADSNTIRIRESYDEHIIRFWLCSCRPALHALGPTSKTT